MGSASSARSGSVTARANWIDPMIIVKRISALPCADSGSSGERRVAISSTKVFVPAV